MNGNVISEKGIHQTCDENHKYPLKGCITVLWHHPRQRRHFDSRITPVGSFNQKHL